MRVMMAMWRARLRRRSPPWLMWWRTVLPEDAGIGLTPASEVPAVSWTVAQYGIIGELSGREMMVAARKYSAEFKDACVQEVLRTSRPIAQVARENGVVEQTLGVWVNAYKKANPSAEPELSVSERARLKQLEAEIRELRAENEFLGKATAFFAKKHR